MLTTQTKASLPIRPKIGYHSNVPRAIAKMRSDWSRQLICNYPENFLKIGPVHAYKQGNKQIKKAVSKWTDFYGTGIDKWIGANHSRLRPKINDSNVWIINLVSWERLDTWTRYHWGTRWTGHNRSPWRYCQSGCSQTDTAVCLPDKQTHK